MVWNKFRVWRAMSLSNIMQYCFNVLAKIIKEIPAFAGMTNLISGMNFNFSRQLQRSLRDDKLQQPLLRGNKLLPYQHHQAFWRVFPEKGQMNERDFVEDP